MAPGRSVLREQDVGFEMCVTSQHLPVLVAGHKRYSFGGQPRFKKTAGSLMSQIMEAQVLNVQSATCPPESRAHGSRIERKELSLIASGVPLFFDQLHCVVTDQVYQRDHLVVSVLLPRILPVADFDELPSSVEVCPFYSHDLSLPHGSRYGELDDAGHWHSEPLPIIELG